MNRQELLEKHIVTSKKMAATRKKWYPYIDQGAFEGALVEHLYTIIYKKDLEMKNPDAFIKTCLTNKAKDLLRSSYHLYRVRCPASYDNENGYENKAITNDVADEHIQKEEKQHYSALVAKLFEQCTDSQETIAKLLMKGFSLRKIAKHMGVSYSYTHREIKRMRSLVKNPFKNPTNSQ